MVAALADPTALEVYRREVTPELYRDVRELYKKHSLAEDARDLDGLISTLTPDCVYKLVQTTQHGSWLGTPPTGEPVEWKVVIRFPWDP
jgi:hypothetical protein